MRTRTFLNTQGNADRSNSVPPAQLTERLLWICPLVAVVAIGVLLWAFGLTLWSAFAAGILLGCPISIACVLVAERHGKPLRPGDR